jgi:hypothetical protein
MRASDDPRYHRARARAIAHLPDPDLGAWHQPGLGAYGGNGGGRRRHVAENGDIDLDDFRAKAEQHAGDGWRPA